MFMYEIYSNILCILFLMVVILVFISFIAFINSANSEKNPFTVFSNVQTGNKTMLVFHEGIGTTFPQSTSGSSVSLSETNHLL